jgi:hypothetical protein
VQRAIAPAVIKGPFGIKRLKGVIDIITGMVKSPGFIPEQEQKQIAFFPGAVCGAHAQLFVKPKASDPFGSGKDGKGDSGTHKISQGYRGVKSRAIKNGTALGFIFGITGIKTEIAVLVEKIEDLFQGIFRIFAVIIGKSNYIAVTIGKPDIPVYTQAGFIASKIFYRKKAIVPGINIKYPVVRVLINDYQLKRSVNLDLKPFKE